MKAFVAFLFIVVAWLVLFYFAGWFSGCAYGQGYWLFPQDSNGYHFDPCLYPEKVRPEDRAKYQIECQ